MSTARLERRFEEIKQEAERRNFHEEFACKKCAWGDGRNCTNSLVTGFDGPKNNVDRQISTYSEDLLWTHCKYGEWGAYGTAVLYCGLGKELWEPRPAALDRVLARIEVVYDWCARALRKGGV